MAELEFFLEDYNFNTGGAGSQEPQSSRMRAMTARGWEIQAVTVAHPNVQVLWQRPVGSKSQDSPEGQPQADLSQELHEAQQRAEHAEAERDQAVAAREAAQREAAQHVQEKQGLQQALAAQQDRAAKAEARVADLQAVAAQQETADEEGPGAQERDGG